MEGVDQAGRVDHAGRLLLSKEEEVEAVAKRDPATLAWPRFVPVCDGGCDPM